MCMAGLKVAHTRARTHPMCVCVYRCRARMCVLACAGVCGKPAPHGWLSRSDRALLHSALGTLLRAAAPNPFGNLARFVCAMSARASSTLLVHFNTLHAVSRVESPTRRDRVCAVE